MSNQTTSTQTPVFPYLNSSWIPIYLLLLIYPLLCALFRNERLRQTREIFQFFTRRSFASMTDRDAMLINQIVGELEFPFTFEKALQFALFRTYGIPSVSKLLVATSQFSEPGTACKRYADTALLISEFMGHDPTSERTRQAIGRMNFIHSNYQKAGKILDDDMLYTLALFACEPVRWINKYEWRQLEDFEVCAQGTFWKSVGDAMGISYEKLKSGTGGKEGTWRDGLDWWEEVNDWTEKYERENMVPTETNRKTAEQTTRILLWTLPGPLKGPGRHLVSALMDDRLRKAMMYPAPPKFYHYFVSLAFGIRKILLRYLAFPRPSFMAAHFMSTSPSKNGTYFTTKYDAAPYYVKPTFSQRWKPGAWYSWFMGLPLPGDEGDKYWPGGYKIPEMGPESMRGKGGDFVNRVAEELRTSRTGGCVFAAKTQ